MVPGAAPARRTAEDAMALSRTLRRAAVWTALAGCAPPPAPPAKPAAARPAQPPAANIVAPKSATGPQKKAEPEQKPEPPKKPEFKVGEREVDG